MQLLQLTIHMTAFVAIDQANNCLCSSGQRRRLQLLQLIIHSVAIVGVDRADDVV